MSRSGTPLGLFVCGGPERGAGSFGDSTFFCTRYDHRFVFASEGDRQDSDLDRTSSMTMSADSNQSLGAGPRSRLDHRVRGQRTQRPTSASEQPTYGATTYCKRLAQEDA